MTRERVSPSEWAGLFAAGIVYLLACNSVYFGNYVDDIVWVLLGRNFLRGSVLAAWSYFPHIETNATWGFPLLLTPVLAVFGTNALALKLWCAAMFFSGTACFYLAIRDNLSPVMRQGCLAGMFLNNFYLAFSGNVISEAAFMFILGTAYYALKKNDWVSKGTSLQTAGLGAIAGLLILTRVLGAAFLIALLTEFCRFRRIKRLPVFLAAAAVVAAPYFIISKAASGTVTFHNVGWAMIAQAGRAGAAGVIFSNTYYYLKGLSLLTFIYFPLVAPNVLWIKVILMAVVWAAALYGAMANWKEDGTLLPTYFLLYAVVCIAWPYQGPRFVVPLYPIFLYWVFRGIEAAASRLKTIVVKSIGSSRYLSERGGAAALVMLILATNATGIAQILRDSWSQPADMPHESFLWLRDHSSPNDLVVSMDIARIAYYSGRRGLHFLPSDSVDSFVAKARRIHAKYFLIKEAGFVPTAFNTPDPIVSEQSRLEEYLPNKKYFSLIYENAAERVRIWELRT